MEVDEGSDQKSDIQPRWMAVHACLKNDFMEEEKYHNLMRWLICQWLQYLTVIYCWKLKPLSNTTFHWQTSQFTCTLLAVLAFGAKSQLEKGHMNMNNCT